MPQLQVLVERPGLGGCQGVVSELLVRCGRGDTEALGMLIDVYQVHVIAAVAATGGVRGADRHDAVISAFMHIWRHAPSYRPESHSAVEWLAAEVSSALRVRPQPMGR